jgi:hypothetical protein
MTRLPNNSLSSNKDSSGDFGLYLTVTGFPSACSCNFSAVSLSSAMNGYLLYRSIRADREKERIGFSLPRGSTPLQDADTSSGLKTGHYKGKRDLVNQNGRSPTPAML